MTSEKTIQNVNIAESLQDIGERLRILRLQQDVDLEGVCKKTKIPIKYLKSIESGDLDSLPELVYVRGFIRRYAQALKQDTESFELGSGPTISRPSLKTRMREIQSSIQVGKLFHQLKYPLYAFLVVSVGSGLVYLNNREFSPAPVQSVTENTVVSQSSP